MHLKTKNDLFIYLFAIGVFLIIISPFLFSDGMFMDGLIYSAIAHNLANGLGTFWDLRFSDTFLVEFHEHPPLAMGLQSIFINIFGENRIFDKLYSILTFAIVGSLIVKIWKLLNKKNGWLPLIFWFSIPLVSWASTNNMLENTLSVFTTLSVWFYLKNEKQNNYFFLSLSGFMLSFGFLTKGFVAFFPLSFPFIWTILFRNKGFKKMTLESLLLIIFSICPLLLLMQLVPEAKACVNKYIEIQVVNSLKNIVTVDSRFFITNRLFTELIPILTLSMLFVVWGFRKKISLSILRNSYKLFFLFFSFGLTGVLPIMISLKQSGYYILATFPFFAIALAALISPIIDVLFSSKLYETKGFAFFKVFSSLLLIIGIGLSIYFSTTIGRDKVKLSESYLIMEKIPEKTTINILPSMGGDYTLYGYYSRYKKISLDVSLENKRDYLLVQTSNLNDMSVTKDYQRIIIPTSEYQLFKRKLRIYQ